MISQNHEILILVQWNICIQIRAKISDNKVYETMYDKGNIPLRTTLDARWGKNKQTNKWSEKALLYISWWHKIYKVVLGNIFASTSFPGFSPTSPYGARERERETGRRESQGTRLSPPVSRETGFPFPAGERLSTFNWTFKVSITVEFNWLIINWTHIFSQQVQRSENP